MQDEIKFQSKIYIRVTVSLHGEFTLRSVSQIWRVPLLLHFTLFSVHYFLCTTQPPDAALTDLYIGWLFCTVFKAISEATMYHGYGKPVRARKKAITVARLLHGRMTCHIKISSEIVENGFNKYCTYTDRQFKLGIVQQYA